MLSANEQSAFVYSGVAYEVDLEPGRGANPYLHAGYRVAPHVTLLGYLDGMRLGRSDTATLVRPGLPTVQLWQPASDMWRLGVRVAYRW
jgi:hypothetical protein